MWNRRALLSLCSLAAACNPDAFDRVSSAAEQPDAADVDGYSSSANADAAAKATQDASVSLDAGIPSGSVVPEAGSAQIDASNGGSRADANVGESSRDGGVADGSLTPSVCGAPDDAKNCGRCGNDCRAAGAQSSCVASSCSNRCQVGFADCNGDLTQAALGNGCEINTESNAKSCGSCGMACIAPTDGYATCRAASCRGSALTRGASIVRPAHGNPEGGEAFAPQLCPANEVLIGLSGFADTYAASSIVGQCARLKLQRTQSGELISVIPSTRLAAIGRGEYTPEGAPFDVTCPANTVVSEVRWSTWALWALPTIKGIELVCSERSIGAAHNVQVKPGQVHRAVGGAPDARDLESIIDICAPTGAVIGFAGRAGAHIDQMAVNCADLTISETAADSQSKPDQIGNVDELGGSTVTNAL